jgi:hypothetical protein
LVGEPVDDLPPFDVEGGDAFGAGSPLVGFYADPGVAGGAYVHAVAFQVEDVEGDFRHAVRLRDWELW